MVYKDSLDPSYPYYLSTLDSPPHLTTCSTSLPSIMAPILRSRPSNPQIQTSPFATMDTYYFPSNEDYHLPSEPYLEESLSPLDCPRSLYADSFNRPDSAGSMSMKRYRKNTKEMTGFNTTEEEFEELPVAVRRKYFSTLERLRFAQSSRANALNNLPIQTPRRTTLTERKGLNVATADSRRGASKSRKHRRAKPSISSQDASWFLTLPDKIKKKEFTKEEQVILTGRLREDVLLDAADEAFYKNSRQASRTLYTYDFTMDSIPKTSFDRRRETMTAEMYDSFRWMDEEDDLNLKLVLDDYHANLDGVKIPNPDSGRRPSFRRQMSVTKTPFGRNSMSYSVQPLLPLSPRFDNTHNHLRQKSRAMSLISPRHTSRSSISSIDPHAAHYQDPEARLKLRVYLASPQKFDEAIEFGFPSADSLIEKDEDKENRVPRQLRPSNVLKNSFSTEKSFLDDTASLFDDDASMIDLDSPLIPLNADAPLKPLTPRPALHKSTKSSSDVLTRPYRRTSESYNSSSAGSREMTLRMTLTRPDLRADETQLYGWQSRKQSYSSELPVMISEDEKFDKGPFGGVDGWGPAEKDNGVRRLWQKVKHPGVQRKLTT